MEDRLRVGVITAPHGIKGEVKVFPTTDDLNRFRDLKRCFLESGDKTMEVECTSCKFLKNMVVLKFAGYDNIEAVESIRQYNILVNREDAVALEDGEFFICDVIGAAVFDQNNIEIGVIDEVLETPANHVFVIKKAGSETRYVPVVKEWVDEIDTEHKRVRVHLYKIAEDE